MPLRTNPFAEDRRQRKNEILKYLANANPYKRPDGLMDSRKITGFFSAKWGYKTSKIYEYIEELGEAEIIKFIGSYIALDVDDEYLDEYFGSRLEWLTIDIELKTKGKKSAAAGSK
jgi:hypothetical protein